jgi:hypothetical protein
MVGLKVAEATGRAMALGGAVVGGEAVEALSVKVFRDAPSRRASLSEAPVTRTSTDYLASPSVLLGEGEGAVANNNRGQTPQWGGGDSFHQRGPAGHNITVGGSRRR